MRKRKCRACGQWFEPSRPLQVSCSLDCAITTGRATHAKKVAKGDAEKRAGLKSLAKLRAEAQAAFNSYIRTRDSGLPCVSCGRHHEGQWHAGHYLTTAAHPELRFEPRNCHRQCSACNTHLSGNLVEYRKGLTLRYGPALVEWLEGPHEAKHYTREELIEAKAYWRQMTRNLIKTEDAALLAREINREIS